MMESRDSDSPLAPERTRARRTPQRKGIFIAVVGPSGAGKDSLIDAAKRHFRRNRQVVFARRVITRPPDVHEEHEPATPEAFATMKARGGFALAWRANGLDYGLPASLAQDIARGAVVVANLSRDVAADIREIFPRALVVLVSAAPEVLATRLASRGREDAAMQKARLARSGALKKSFVADLEIENNGALAEAEARFIALIAQFAPVVD